MPLLLGSVRFPLAARIAVLTTFFGVITPQTFIQIGARGIVATGVAQARDTWGYPDDPDSVRLIGMTFGVGRKF